MKIKQRIVTTLIATLMVISAYGQKTKVACVGNSVTFGAGIADRANDSYPAQLQILLCDTSAGLPASTFQSIIIEE